MNLKKLNEKLEKLLNTTKMNEASSKGRKLLQVGSFHDDPENIYYNADPSVANSFDKCDFDNYDDEYLEDNLIFLTATDDYISLEKTPYKSVADFEKEIINSYPPLKKEFDENKYVYLEPGDDPNLQYTQYFEGLDVEEEKNIESPEALKNYVIDCLNDTYIDGDSNAVRAFIDPKTMEIVLGGDVDLSQFDPDEFNDDSYDDEEEEDY